MSYNFSTITPHSLSRSKVLQSDIRIHQMHFQDRGVGIVLEVDVVAHVELDFLRLAVSHNLGPCQPSCLCGEERLGRLVGNYYFL